MADTTKIKKLIYALSIELGLGKPDWKELNKLSFEQLMAKADELRKKEEEVKEYTGKNTEATADEQFNGATFGMCFKLVYDNSGKDWIKENEFGFVEKVYRMYLLAEECKKVIKKGDCFDGLMDSAAGTPIDDEKVVM